MREEPAAVVTVRGWVEAMVYGGWRLPDPEAVVQEIMLELTQWSRRGQRQAPERFRAYVLTVARHTCIDVHRRELLRATDELPDEVPAPAGDSGGDDPESRLLDRQKRRIARSILQSLSEECRELLALVFGEGLGANKAGERLGISAGNVRVRTHRCLRAARALRAECWPELEAASGDAGGPGRVGGPRR